MSVQPEHWPPAVSEEELMPRLELVVDDTKPRLPRPPAGYYNGPMANWEVSTWSTMPERDHEYNGVLSCADPLPDGSPRRFASETAYQAYRATKHKSIANNAEKC